MTLRCGKFDAGNDEDRCSLRRLNSALDVVDFVVIRDRNDGQALARRRLHDPISRHGWILHVMRCAERMDV